MESTITLTFGDCAENHVGMQQIGAISDTGFEIQELESAQIKFEEKGCVTELINLNDYLPESYKSKADEARVLVVRKGIGAFVPIDELQAEQKKLTPDTKFYHAR